MQDWLAVAVLEHGKRRSGAGDDAHVPVSGVCSPLCRAVGRVCAARPVAVYAGQSEPLLRSAALCSYRGLCEHVRVSVSMRAYVREFVDFVSTFLCVCVYSLEYL